MNPISCIIFLTYLVTWLPGHEFEQTLGDGEGQGSLVCCSPWGRRVGYNLVTEQQSFLHLPEVRKALKSIRYLLLVTSSNLLLRCMLDCISHFSKI